MGQNLGADRNGSLQRNSTTQVQLNLSPQGDIRTTIGGQQYYGSSALLLNTGGTGFGGLDTGAIAASQVYFVHLVLNGSAPALIASLSKTAPTGYTAFSWIGVFSTNASSQVDQCGLTTVKILRSLLSGSGTYTTQAALLKIRMVGGGGGGAGGNSNPGAGTNGGNTTFGTSLLTANGGTAATGTGTSGGGGGTFTINTPATGFGFNGGDGGRGSVNPAGISIPSGQGGISAFGGAGTPNHNAITNSGSGGAGGAALGSGTEGQGGGAGAYIEAIIPSPSSSYSYSVGISGALGGNAFAGGSGAIYIEESYV
jgi:hypothetical protein